MRALGLCCECGAKPATGFMMLNRLAPKAGTGWGCLVCNLPQDGAVAVLCDECGAALEFKAGRVPRFVCVGYSKDNERMAFADLPLGFFDHDLSKHPEIIH